MPFDTDGSFDPITGSETATPGAVIRSAVWNSIFTDMANTFTLIGQGVAIEFVMRDSSASPITTGVKGYIEIPFDLTFLSWKIMSDQVGSAVIDLWLAPFASFPPLVGNSITGSAPPTLTAAASASSSTLTGWTTVAAKTNILAFNVNSIAASRQLTISLACGRNT